MADETLTEIGASHEVVSCLFGVFAVHFPGFGVELGEHVTMEAVKVFHEAESRRAVWHVLELFLIYSLRSDIVVVDFISCIQKRGGAQEKMLSDIRCIQFDGINEAFPCSVHTKNIPLKKMTESSSHSGWGHSTAASRGPWIPGKTSWMVLG